MPSSIKFIISPEIAFNYGHFDIIEHVVNSTNVEDFKEKCTSIQTKPMEKQQILQNIPKLVAAISNVNPLIKITE
ncbi:46359_t:CDS:2, partial [Gigaspora margarita]